MQSISVAYSLTIYQKIFFIWKIIQMSFIENILNC